MEHKKVSKGIFEKSGKIHDKKQQNIITDNLDIEKDSQVLAGKVSFFHNTQIEREQQVAETEQTRKDVQQLVAERIFELNSYKHESRQNTGAGDPAEYDKPTGDQVQIRMARGIDFWNRAILLHV